MWEQYRRYGMQGQVGLGTLNVNGYYGVGPPVATQYGIKPVHRVGRCYYSPCTDFYLWVGEVNLGGRKKKGVLGHFA